MLILFNKLNNLTMFENMKSNLNPFHLSLVFWWTIPQKWFWWCHFDRLARTSINSSPPAVSLLQSSNSKWNAYFSKSSQLPLKKQATPSIFLFEYSFSQVWNHTVLLDKNSIASSVSWQQVCHFLERTSDLCLNTYCYILNNHKQDNKRVQELHLSLYPNTTD